MPFPFHHSIRSVRRTIEPGTDSFPLRERSPRKSPADTAAPGTAARGTAAPETTIRETPAPEAAAPGLTVRGASPTAPTAPESTASETTGPADGTPELSTPDTVRVPPTVPEPTLGGEPARPDIGAPLQAPPLPDRELDEAQDSFSSLYARSRGPRRRRRTQRPGRPHPTGPARAWARRAFALVALLGFAFYWFDPGLGLRAERVAMFTRSAEWWRGIRGKMLTHHRPGLQVAYINPQSGELFAVWDAQADVTVVQRALNLLPAGHWAVVTVLNTGDQPTVDRLRELLQASGWTEPISADGAAIAVFGHSNQEGKLSLLASRAEAKPDARLTLPRGLQGEDGTRLADPFPIHVQE